MDTICFWTWESFIQIESFLIPSLAFHPFTLLFLIVVGGIEEGEGFQCCTISDSGSYRKEHLFWLFSG